MYTKRKFRYAQHSSGVAWVDFTFRRMRVVLVKVVEKIVLKKRLTHTDHTKTSGRKCVLLGLWVPSEKTIYINSATKDLKGAHHPMTKTLIHELYHILDETASEQEVIRADKILWRMYSPGQKEELKRFIPKNDPSVELLLL